MPIYEYKAIVKGCDYCLDGFEIRQNLNTVPLSRCPKCQGPIRKLVSQFRACVVETSNEALSAEMKIRDYEKEGRWSHAAELADKYGLEDRAKEDYKKARRDF
jgi:putative FmdB family regulatory protein